ncbi:MULTISPECIES: alpha/beta fold hydrolase BchO [Rhodomicrobium]|uniref:alpha/beta fold hydrolase BchO n=1 Tax=Rhodomicrobium TaxID=1068 RepID=UPI001FDA8CFF|nr:MULTISPECIES: alpha/beta fold hydrolase BchO [Rhodomicrobium]
MSGNGDGALVWDRDGRDWPNRETSRFVQAAGLRWHVQQAGSGPVMLLAHGTGASTHSWAGLLPLLAERFTVIAPDLPGHGFTDPLPSMQMSLPGMAAALAGLVERLGVKPDIVVGHSAGAAILAQMILDRQIAPRLLISLNGALIPYGGAAGRFISSMAKVLFINPVAPRFFAWRARDRRTVERVIGGTGSTISPGGLAIYQRLFRSPVHVSAALNMMARWKLSPLAQELPRLPCAVTLVAGSHDLAVPPDQAFKLAETMLAAKVELLRGLGHLAHEEDPARVAEVIFTTVGGLTPEASRRVP